jgi:hypothetical protein
MCNAHQQSNTEPLKGYLKASPLAPAPLSTMLSIKTFGLSKEVDRGMYTPLVLMACMVNTLVNVFAQLVFIKWRASSSRICTSNDWNM